MPTLSPRSTPATAARLLFQRLDQGRHRRPQRRPIMSFLPMLATVSSEALLAVFLRLPSFSPLFSAAKLRPRSIAAVEDHRLSRSLATLISLKHPNTTHRFDFIVSQLPSFGARALTINFLRVSKLFGSCGRSGRDGRCACLGGNRERRPPGRHLVVLRQLDNHGDETKESTSYVSAVRLR